MTTKKMSRRDMLKLTGTLAASTLLAACATPTPQVIRETVEVPVEKTVKETVVVTEKETVKETVVVEAAPVAEAVTGNVVVSHFLHEFTADHAAAFMAENPGITVEVVDAADANKVFAMIAAGTPPDLHRCQAPWVPQQMARGLLKDLTPYFEASELCKLDDLMPANNYYKARSPLEIGEGSIYGMCKDFSPDLTIFANKKLFDEAGVAIDDTKAMTMTEVWEAARATTKFDGDRVVNIGFAHEGAWIDRYLMVGLMETGETLYTEASDAVNLSGSEQAMSMAKTYFDMQSEKVMLSPINPSPGGWSGNDFLAGILAMEQYGFWFSAMAESDNQRGSVMLLPAPTWTGTRMTPTITATGMVMLSPSKFPDAAWKVFEFYNGGQPSIDRAKSGWGVPALKSQLSLIPQESDFQKQAFRVLQAELDLNTPPVKFNPYLGETAFADAWNKNLDQALKGEIAFEDMIVNVEAEVNLVIQEGIDRLLG
jgi:multiple sugar transport system substrate-binding protein